MAGGQLGSLLQHVRDALGGRGAADSADADLLRRFAVRRDESAFAALLQRHGRMVLGVCRRILPHAADADDAFQATFLVLVRRAGSIARGEALGGWLHGVARRVALEARTRAARRREGERRTDAEGQGDPIAESSGRELRSLLDGELAQLPAKYRLPLVLHYLEGMTKDETARQLGWTEGTVSGRLARAREMLRDRLTRRGLTVSGGVLAATLAEEGAASAVPSAPFVTATLPVALTAQAAPAVATLADGVLPSTLLARLSVAVLIAGILGIAGVGWSSYGAPAGGRPNAIEPPPLPPAVTPADAPKPKERADDWVPLFNGKDLKGWFVEGGDPGSWKVEHGELVVDSGFVPAKEQGIHNATSRPRYNWLLTEKTYSEFLLRFEYQMSQGANSGVALWAKPDEKVYREGPIHPEVKLLDDPSYPKIGWPTGTLFWNLDGGGHLQPPDKPAKLKPAGSWNVMEIEARAQSLRVSVNGVEVLSARPDKLAEEPGAFAGLKRCSGHLGFEKNAGAVRFRKLEVKEITAPGSKEKPAKTAGDPNVLKPASDAPAKEAPPAPVKKPGTTFRVNHSGTSEVALSADGKLLARGAIDGVVDVWDVATGKKLHTLKGHTTWVVRVVFSPDGKTLASAATTWGVATPADKNVGPGEMKLWDLVTGKERVTLKSHPGLALSLAFSPDGKTLATESGTEEEKDPSGLVKLWDVDTGKEKLKLKQDKCVQSLAFSPDGKTLAVGTGGFFMEPPGPSWVLLWDVTTGKERVRTLPTHTGWISWVGFAPDGKTLASVSCNAHKDEKPIPAQLKLWDAATAKERASIPLRMAGPIQFFSLAFTADGKTLTSAMWTDDGKEKELGLAVDHWDLATGKARATFWAPLPRITYGERRDLGRPIFSMAALSADGKTVAWPGAEKEPKNNIGTAHVWDVQSLATSPPKLAADPGKPD